MDIWIFLMTRRIAGGALATGTQVEIRFGLSRDESGVCKIAKKQPRLRLQPLRWLADLMRLGADVPRMAARRLGGLSASGWAAAGKAARRLKVQLPYRSAVDGSAADGSAADGKAAGGKAAAGKVADGQTADGKAADGKAD